MKSLKPVYTAPSEAAAKDRFEEFTQAWGERYPAIIQLWRNSWAEFVPTPRTDNQTVPTASLR
ncbi:transposase [Planctomonas sp. JC2975]|uniref:transposase n=1 Tax=Planctomonas sp. JC2975 TaxID=2729626 RepID=UPI003211E504